MYEFKKMGQDTRPFFNAALAAYNRKVRKALFAQEDPLLATTSGGTPVEAHKDCVLRLPPNLSVQRVPLAFVDSFSEEAQAVRLGVRDGSSYTFARLGQDTRQFALAIQRSIRALREKSRTAVMELDPSLSAEQSAALSGILPYGTAVSVGLLRSVAPSFVAALESRIAQSRASQSYEFFKTLGNRSLQQVRSSCIGRVIHSSPAAWQKKVRGFLA